MKKMMKTWVIVAVAAMGLTACQSDFEEQIGVKNSVTIEFIADSAESRTSVDTSGDTPLFAWSESERFMVLEQTTFLAEATNVTYTKEEDKAKITATFNPNIGHASYDYVTVYPAEGYVGANSLEDATLALPAEQTMGEGSYDPTADLMVSKVVTFDAQPTEAQMVQFTRLAAVAKMSFKGLGTESVESATFTAEGKTLAGQVTCNLTTAELTAVEGEGSDSVTVTTSDPATVVYFTLLPATLEAGDSYTVTVVTDTKIYRKTATIPDGKSLIFESGMVTRFGVDLTTATVSDKWELVRDVKDLEAGDVVTFATAPADLNWVMGKHGGSYHYASYTAIIKMGDYFFHPVAASASEANNRVQQLIVAPRAGKENAFEFYNGVDYTGDTYKGYLCTSSQNYLKLQNYPTNNSLFYVEIDPVSGVASVVAEDSENSAKNLKYRAYSKGTTTSNRRFVCTNTVTAGEHYDVCIYKMAGGVKQEVPTADAVIVVPDADEPVVVAKEGVATDQAFEEVEFTYVGDWTITPTTQDDCDWLTLKYADGKLFYTATANEGEVRNATVTITASHDGKADIVKTFNVIQKGVPVEISIKDFAKIEEVDENVEYRVTGVLTVKATGNSSNTTLSDVDGNTANFRYVEMADGTSFYNNDNIQEGDVVTIVAAKSYSSSYGGSSSSHSICQGYYNLTATATTDHVAYGGGEVKITLGKTGTLTPQTISGHKDADFATLTYTENAMEATVQLDANDGAPRQAVVTFTDGYATAAVTIVQAADPSKGLTWELVTDANTLEAGDKVIIAAKEYDVAMSTTISSDKRGEVAITKLGNYYLTPAMGTQTFILGAGTVAGTFAFYDADQKGFLVSSNTSAELVNQSYNNANTSFGVSIADGVATIGNKEGDFASNQLAYYNNGTNKYFCSSNATSSYYKPLSLYRLVGAKGVIPVVAADVTVNDAVISDAAATATAIPEVVFNYVGDWTITATSEATWLTSFHFDKEQNCLTYSAEANTGVARTATVIITATYPGESDQTWTFNLLQKGYTPKMTIAEYNAIPVADRNDSEYMRYELTGRIESIESTSATNCKFTINDETATVQVYGLETEDGSKDYGDFDLKVGDVVTLTVPRFTEVNTAGKGSTNPAHYLSHYNISATATAAEYTANSTATISVVSTSGLEVSYEMAACDFAELSYTTDSSQENTTATVTFTSENSAEQARSVDVTFKTGLASTTVTVTQKIDPAKVKGWVLVTDASELAVGDEVIIVAKNFDVAFGCFTSSSTSTANKNTSAVEIVGNSIASEEVVNKSVQTFTLVEGYVENSFAFEFTYNSNTYYLYASSSGLVLNSSKASALRAYKIEVEADGNATIKSQGTTTYEITYNYKVTTPSFTSSKSSNALITDAQADICIYKNSEK